MDTLPPEIMVESKVTGGKAPEIELSQLTFEVDNGSEAFQEAKHSMGWAILVGRNEDYKNKEGLKIKPTI